MSALAYTALLLTLTSACGSDATPEDRLNGVWGIELSSACVAGIAFNGDNHGYASQVICALDGGGAGSELEAGEFSATSDSLTQTPRRSSCVEHVTGTETVHYTISGDSLSVVTNTGIVIMKRIPSMPSGSTGTATFGCWNMGRFFARPVADL